MLVAWVCMEMVSAEQKWVGYQSCVLELVLQADIRGTISSGTFSEDDTLATKSNSNHDHSRCPRRQATVTRFSSRDLVGTRTWKDS